MSQQRNLPENLLQLQLLLAERSRTQTELIKYFGVNRKTVKRAIDRLSLTHPVAEERDGRNVVYSCGEFESPQFTPTELAALVLAQEAIIATGEASINSPFAAAARSLIEKVREKLPPISREKLDALAAVYGSSALPAKDFGKHAATIEILANAATARRRIELHYHNLSQNRTSRRRFDPYAVYFDPDGATLKVIGFDDERQAIIPFSIDRIRKVSLTTEVFGRPDGFNLREFLEQNCFNGIHGAPIQVQLKAYGVTARIFAERQFHPSQKIISQTTANGNGEETTTIEMHVAGGRGLERFILSFMPDVEVLFPAGLRDKIVEIQQTALSRNAKK